MYTEQQYHTPVDLCFLSDRCTWTTWSAWGDCSATCGGGSQQRTRVCVKEPEDLDCVGDDNQNRNCNSHDCPGNLGNIVTVNDLRSMTYKIC